MDVRVCVYVCVCVCIYIYIHIRRAGPVIAPTRGAALSQARGRRPWPIPAPAGACAPCRQGGRVRGGGQGACGRLAPQAVGGAARVLAGCWRPVLGRVVLLCCARASASASPHHRRCENDIAAREPLLRAVRQAPCPRRRRRPPRPTPSSAGLCLATVAVRRPSPVFRRAHSAESPHPSYLCARRTPSLPGPRAASRVLCVICGLAGTGTGRGGIERDGTGRDGVDLDRTGRGGPGRAGAGLDGAGRGGTGSDGTVRGGAGRGWTGRDGTERGGMGRDGAAHLSHQVCSRPRARAACSAVLRTLVFCQPLFCGRSPPRRRCPSPSRNAPRLCAPRPFSPIAP